MLNLDPYVDFPSLFFSSFSFCDFQTCSFIFGMYYYVVVFFWFFFFFCEKLTLFFHAGQIEFKVWPILLHVIFRVYVDGFLLVNVFRCLGVMIASLLQFYCLWDFHFLFYFDLIDWRSNWSSTRKSESLPLGILHWNVIFSRFRWWSRIQWNLMGPSLVRTST